MLAVFVLYLIFFVKYDSPKYYATKNEDYTAKKVIRQIYETDSVNCTDEQILEEIKSLSSIDNNDVSLLDTFWND